MLQHHVKLKECLHSSNAPGPARQLSQNPELPAGKKLTLFILLVFLQSIQEQNGK